VGVIGGVALIALVVVWWVWCRKKKIKTIQQRMKGSNEAIETEFAGTGLEAPKPTRPSQKYARKK
jgi:hypothetical protein